LFVLGLRVGARLSNILEKFVQPTTSNDLL